MTSTDARQSREKEVREEREGRRGEKEREERSGEKPEKAKSLREGARWRRPAGIRGKRGVVHVTESEREKRREVVGRE